MIDSCVSNACFPVDPEFFDQFRGDLMNGHVLKVVFNDVGFREIGSMAVFAGRLGLGFGLKVGPEFGEVVKFGDVNMDREELHFITGDDAQVEGAEKVLARKFVPA